MSFQQLNLNLHIFLLNAYCVFICLITSLITSISDSGTKSTLLTSKNQQNRYQTLYKSDKSA